MKVRKGILKATLFSLFVFCFSTKHYSQKTGIKGVVVDNTNGSTPKVVGFKN
ncbi:hypothetical protein [uncultured Polaribacter sp.]|mgnify:CR=1 FL=1|uniref:hypothetical protein n=1 Tax=uncultured Polaribacter sp. TaxID=174711 RepID=UPI0030DC9D93|tara:strand:- start:381 stop:536 length:156 start_codon:yes stop_codon:yes gene_type:complete